MKRQFVIQCKNCNVVYQPNKDKECPCCYAVGDGKFLPKNTYGGDYDYLEPDISEQYINWGY